MGVWERGQEWRGILSGCRGGRERCGEGCPVVGGERRFSGREGLLEGEDLTCLPMMPMHAIQGVDMIWPFAREAS